MTFVAVMIGSSPFWILFPFLLPVMLTLAVTLYLLQKVTEMD